ncbi:hypothetical protein TWF281_004182 [Arthrobotrys megalospora]
MPAIIDLPAEVQIEFLSYLPFSSLILAAQVGTLWRSILSCSAFQRAQYRLFEPLQVNNPTGVVNILRGSGGRPTDEATYFKIHKLLSHKFPGGAFCTRCRHHSRYLRYLGELRSRVYENGPGSFSSIKLLSTGFLVGELCPSTLQITNYHIWYQARCPIAGPGRDKWFSQKVQLGLSHPFLNEPVFSGTVSGEGKGDVALFSEFCFLEDFWKVHQTSDMKQQTITPVTTVRELAEQTWQEIRRVYLSDPDPHIRAVEFVTFCFDAFFDAAPSKWEKFPRFRVEVGVDTGKPAKVVGKPVWRFESKDWTVAAEKITKRKV